MTTNRKKLKTFSQFIEEHKIPFGLVINQSETTQWSTEKIFQLPVGWL